MRKLDPATYRTMPWKNGGGVTTEVLVLPEGADVATFDLRVSRATVAASGPFSEFPGVDRTLVVTAGAGIAVETADGAQLTLDATSAPFMFTGDDPVHATLVEGPVEDLNVMTRRAAVRHVASRVVLDQSLRFLVAGDPTLWAVLDGDVVAQCGSVEVRLGAGDILHLTPADDTLTLAPLAAGTRASLLAVTVLPGPAK